MFITVEGGEGSGKSTQSALISHYLNENGVKAILTREPGGSKGGEQLRELLLNADGIHDWTAWGEALLFTAARREHIDHLIKPALKNKAWVICDRYLDSMRAYQGVYANMVDADILALHRLTCDNFMPQYTFLIDLDWEEAAKRVYARDKGKGDRIGSRPAEYHTAVRKRFHDMARAEGGRFIPINGSGEQELVFKRLRPYLDKWLGK